DQLVGLPAADPLVRHQDGEDKGQGGRQEREYDVRVHRRWMPPTHLRVPGFRANDGAHVRARTGDLFLTKEVLCQLSYVGPRGMPLGFRPGDADCAILAESAQPSAYLGKSAYWTEWSRFGWCWWAGRESNPHSLSTADLQSAELTTCSTYPGRKRPARW